MLTEELVRTILEDRRAEAAQEALVRLAREANRNDATASGRPPATTWRMRLADLVAGTPRRAEIPCPDVPRSTRLTA